MFITHQAVLLSTIKYSESAVIAKFFTREEGIITVMCNGVRNSKKGGKMGLLKPASLCEIVVATKPNKSMSNLKEIRNTPPLVYLSSQPEMIHFCFYVSGVIDQFAHENHDDAGLFDFVWQYISGVEEKNYSIVNLPLHFLVGVLKIEGYLPYPDFSHSSNTVKMAEQDEMNATLIQLCAEQPVDLIAETKLDAESRRNCLEYLVNSASGTLQSNRLKGVYEQIKMLY